MFSPRHSIFLFTHINTIQAYSIKHSRLAWQFTRNLTLQHIIQLHQLSTIANIHDDKHEAIEREVLEVFKIQPQKTIANNTKCNATILRQHPRHVLPWTTGSNELFRKSYCHHHRRKHRSRIRSLWTPYSSPCVQDHPGCPIITERIWRRQDVTNKVPY